MRIARRSTDPFLRLLTATTTMWVIGQVFINVGYVIGLLPITGLQLPLISAGGTSTATTLLMIGVMANAARHEPEAVAALRAGRDDRMNRLLRLPLPEPYTPSPVEALRDRLRSRAQPVTRQRNPTARPRHRGGAIGKTPHDPSAGRHSGHHGGRQRHTGQRQPRNGRARALEGQHY
ncbi:cell cycle family protein [Mycobacterium xenopi 3993]|nr:cell cycle family protein [Mycobacterium xenopi 3993]